MVVRLIRPTPLQLARSRIMNEKSYTEESVLSICCENLTEQGHNIFYDKNNF